jgi:hypothetical protein
MSPPHRVRRTEGTAPLSAQASVHARVRAREWLSCRQPTQLWASYGTENRRPHPVLSRAVLLSHFVCRIVLRCGHHADSESALDVDNRLECSRQLAVLVRPQGEGPGSETSRSGADSSGADLGSGIRCPLRSEADLDALARNGHARCGGARQGRAGTIRMNPCRRARRCAARGLQALRERVQELHERRDRPIESLHLGIRRLDQVVLIGRVRSRSMAEPKVPRGQIQRRTGKHVPGP